MNSSYVRPINISSPGQRIPYPTPQAFVPNQNKLLSSASSSTWIVTPRQNRGRRRYSPYLRTSRKRPFFWNLNCHKKFVEAAKQSGGLDKVSAVAVWEIMKAEMDDAIPTLKDASSVLSMLQFMFPEYLVNPPSSVTFYIDVQSESVSCDTMVSDFGKLKLAPKTESGGSADTVLNDLGKLKLENDSVLDDLGKLKLEETMLSE